MSSPARGKEQKVAYFGMVRSGMLVVKPAAPPPNVFSNRFAKAGLPATVTVILFGWDSYKAENDTIDPNLTCENYLKLQGWRPHVLQAVLSRGESWIPAHRRPRRSERPHREFWDPSKERAVLQPG